MLVGSYMVSHGGIAPRREADALAMGARSMEFWRKGTQAGRVRQVGPFYLAPGSGAHGDIAYFCLYLGTLKDLHEIVMSEEYERIYAVASQIFIGFKTRLFGGGTDDEVARVTRVVSQEWGAAGFIGNPGVAGPRGGGGQTSGTTSQEAP